MNDTPRQGEYEKRQNPGGKWYFIVKAANGEIVSRSEHYETESGVERGIEDHKRAAAQAAGQPTEEPSQS